MGRKVSCSMKLRYRIAFGQHRLHAPEHVGSVTQISWTHAVNDYEVFKALQPVREGEEIDHG